MNNVAIISNQSPHYTGGRVFLFQLGVALSELGCSVTMFVDKPVPFKKDFDLYRQPKEVVTYFDSPVMNGYDLYIGLPMTGAEAACRLGMRNRSPAIVTVLDVLPLMKKYRDDRSPALNSYFWSGMVRSIQHTDAYVFVLANHNRKPCAEWLGIPESKVFTVYPAVNDRVMDELPKRDRKYEACFVSRLVPHKRFVHAVDAVKPLGLHLNVVTAKSDPEVVKHRDMTDYVTFHIGVSDRVKFRIISESLLLVFSSVWEGFGMAIIEALACGTPVVCYSFPVFREIIDGSEYERYVYFAKYGDRVDLQKQAMRCISDQYWGNFVPDGRFGMNAMMARLASILGRI